MSNFSSEFVFDSPFDSPFDAGDIFLNNDNSNNVSENVNNVENSNQEDSQSLQKDDSNQHSNLESSNVELKTNSFSTGEGINNENTENINKEQVIISSSQQPDSQHEEHSNNQQLNQSSNNQSELPLNSQPEQVSNVQLNQNSNNQPEKVTNQTSNDNTEKISNIQPEQTSNNQPLSDQSNINHSQVSNTQPTQPSTNNLQFLNIQPLNISGELSIEEQLAILRQQQELLLKQQEELLRKQQQQQQQNQQQQQPQQNQQQQQPQQPQPQLNSDQQNASITQQTNQVQLKETTSDTEKVQQEQSQQTPQTSINSPQPVLSNQQQQNNPSPQVTTTPINQETKPVSQLSTQTIDPSTMWKEAKAPNGRTYYYNKITKQTTWKRPPEYQGPTSPRSGDASVVPTSSSSSSSEQLQVNQVVYKHEVGQLQTPQSTDQLQNQQSTDQPQNQQSTDQPQNQQLADQSQNQQSTDQPQNQQTSIQFNSLFRTTSDLSEPESSQPEQQQQQQQQTPSTQPVESNQTTEVQAQKPLPKLFRVRLPDDQRQVVRFRPNDVLRDILKKICASRPFTEEDYIPKDSTGKVIDMDLTLGEIGLEEIIFTTPKDGFKAKDESDQKKSKRILSDIYHVNASLSSSLHTAIKLYKEPLLEISRNTDAKLVTITEAQCEELFTPLQQIADECYSFKQILASHIETWPLNLEEPLRKHLNIIPHYLNYVNNFNDTMLLIEKLRDNAIFSDKVDTIQRKNGQKLKLEDFFILPASKISVIVDLINELCQLLGDVHDNYVLLKELYDRLFPHKELSMKIKTEYVSRSKILYIEKNVQKLPKKLQLLSEPRNFYREGIVDIEIKKNGKTMPFYVFIFTDIMVICKYEKKAKKPISYTFFDIVNFIKDATHVEETTSSSYTFSINIDNPKKGKLVYTCTVTNQTEGTKADWMASFRSAIQELNSKQ